MQVVSLLPGSASGKASFCFDYLKRKPSRRTQAKGGIHMTLSEVLLLLTLLWNMMKGTFDIVMKLSDKEHDDNKKD